MLLCGSPSAPLPFLLLPLLLIATSTCDGGSGDAQKEAPLTPALPEARSKGEISPTDLEPAAREGGFRDGPEARGDGGSTGESRRRPEEAKMAGGRGRRRHADYATRAPQWPRLQAHSAPHTMSQTLYDHFRPLDPELPSGDLLPFLQFGMKLPVSPTKVKNSHQGPSTTAATPSRSTTFPSASTNALVEDREESDNEMSGLEEESPSRGQSHSIRANSKLKAAILLQMMVNNVKRKKLALRGNLWAKEGSKEGIKEGSDEEGEWGVGRGEEEESGEEGETLTATNNKRRLVLVTRRRKKTNGEEDEGDPEDSSGEMVSSNTEESEEILQNDAPAEDSEDTFTIPPEIEAKEWKVAPAPKTLSTEELLVNDSSEVTTPTAPEPLSTFAPVQDTPSSILLPKTVSTHITLTTPSLTISTSTTPPPNPPPVPLTSPSTTSSIPTSSPALISDFIPSSSSPGPASSPSPITYSSTHVISSTTPISSSPAPVSSSLTPISSSPAPVSSSTTPISSSTAPIPSSPTPISSSFSPVSSSPAQVSSSPSPVSSSPAPVSSSPSPVSSSPAPVSSSPAPVSSSPAPVSSSPTPIPSSPTPIPSSPTPIPSSPTPISSSSTLISTLPTPIPSSLSSSSLPISSSPPSTTTTSTSSPPSPTSASTQSTTTTSTTPPSTGSLPSPSSPSPVPQRIPSKPRLSQYPTLLSNHPIPSTPSLNGTRTTFNRHPILHRDHHRPPHVIFVPPSLRPPIPRRPFPPPSSIPAKKTPQVPTAAPSSQSTPKKELPVKAELEARDWVAVPPPNTTSSPSGSSTNKSLSASPSPTKPHPNRVEKGWQRPYHPSQAVPPHSFPPFIQIEHHFSLPWQPASVPHAPRTTSQSPPFSTTGREVLSVVTSVSVESSPKLNPVSSTTTSKLSTTPRMPESGLVELEGSPTMDGSSNEIGSENYPSQFPHQVSVFVEEGVASDNGLSIGEGQVVESDPDVVAEPGMASTTTYVLLSLAVVPGVVALASAARCLLLHRKKSLYESETSSEVSCMGGRTLKACSRSSHISHAMAAEESSSMRPGSDVFRVITRLPRVAHLGWEHERRQRGKGGRADGGMLDGEEVPDREDEHSTKDAVQIGNWEFPRSKLRLQTLLGQGNFGQVWKAEADGICDAEGSTRLVAVKLVKVKEGEEEKEAIEDLSPCTQSPLPLSKRQGEHLSPMDQCRRKRREDFMAELGIMQLLSPPHPNVVTLLGCCTTTEPPLLIMEYVMFGKLLTFLREHRCKHRYANVSDDPEILTSRDLLVFAYCVLKGMEYLVSKGVVHRDLAARNILVDHNKTCKIADFGMSRCVRDTSGQVYEEKQKQGALPVRWMAPESLFRGLFTHKSDVWSFGVLLWEIITLGSTPYPGIGARDVMRRVRDGRRLERPSHVRPEIFRVAARCWHRDPSLRPTFSRLRADMGPLLASASAGINRGSGGMDSDLCLVSNRGNRRWRPPGPQIDLNQFDDDSG